MRVLCLAAVVASTQALQVDEDAEWGFGGMLSKAKKAAKAASAAHDIAKDEKTKECMKVASEYMNTA